MSSVRAALPSLLYTLPYPLHTFNYTRASQPLHRETTLSLLRTMPPLVETVLSLLQTILPHRETVLSLLRTTLPLAETMLSLLRTTLPLAETMLSLLRTTLPLAETVLRPHRITCGASAGSSDRRWGFGLPPAPLRCTIAAQLAFRSSTRFVREGPGSRRERSERRLEGSERASRTARGRPPGGCSARSVELLEPLGVWRRGR
jgi:hypothetical protein